MHFYIWTRSERERIREQRILQARARAGDGEAMDLLRRMGVTGYFHRGVTVMGDERFNPLERVRKG